MAKKVKLTRPELKRYRDALARYERFLPMLKLKQQQLQIMLRHIAQQRREAEAARDEILSAIGRYRSLLGDRAGVNLEQWARPSKVRTTTTNVAGVELPVFQDVEFPLATYSLFGTPPWVDQVLGDLRERSRRETALAILLQEETLLRNELSRIIQRVNLFEKIMIPHAREAIRKIRIKLGDEMTAAVGRGKIAKKKIADTRTDDPADLSIPPVEVDEDGADPAGTEDPERDQA